MCALVTAFYAGQGTQLAYKQGNIPETIIGACAMLGFAIYGVTSIKLKKRVKVGT